MSDRNIFTMLGALRGQPAEGRRFLGAEAFASYGRSTKTVPIGVGRMFVRMPDSTMVGVDVADYSNGGLP